MRVPCASTHARLAGLRRRRGAPVAVDDVEAARDAPAQVGVAPVDAGVERARS